MATRWVVAKNIWQYMVSICAAYFVTLSLYPGIISEIKRCPEDHWFPVLLMTLFNGTDLIGKVCNFIINTSCFVDLYRVFHTHMKLLHGRFKATYVALM